MNTEPVCKLMKRRSRDASGFSLIEVVIALGLVALAIPLIMGMFGSFSKYSVEIRDRDDIKSVVNEVSLYLENEADLESGGDSFTTVYEWVLKASQNQDDAKVLYAYKPTGSDSGYTVSVTPPLDREISASDGRIMAVEIMAPPETVLSKAELNSDVSNYGKAYLPLELHIYALSIAVGPRTKVNFLDSFPVVLPR